jgi:tetratricopeptide (TPR) repeat protein
MKELKKNVIVILMGIIISVSLNHCIEIKFEKSEAAKHYDQGLKYLSEGKLTEAMAEFNKAIEIDPEYVQAYNNRGGIYVEKGLYDKAILDFEKTIELDSTYAMAYINRAFVNSQRGLYDKVISDCSKAIKIDINQYMAYQNRANAYFKKELYDLAISDLRTVIKIEHDYADAYFSLAWIFEHLGNIKKAIPAYKDYLRYAKSQEQAKIEHVKQKIKEAESIKMRVSIIQVKSEKEAKQLIEKLNNGADFAALAGQFSLGPGKDKGGDLGYFIPGDLVKELNDVAVKLKIGEYSKSIESVDGFYIIRKTEEKPALQYTEN